MIAYDGGITPFESARSVRRYFPRESCILQSAKVVEYVQPGRKERGALIKVEYFIYYYMGIS
jgi:hypothetical protein